MKFKKKTFPVTFKMIRIIYCQVPTKFTEDGGENKY